MLSKIKSSTKFKLVHRSLKSIINEYFINNSRFLPEDIDRVYHIHVRKSGGSSVNDAFWKLAGYNLKKAKREPLLIGKGKSIARYSDVLINAGKYFYASSHFPIWQLQLKPNTFTFTILRDPYKRLVSLYKYYKWVEQVDEKVGSNLDPSYFVLKSQKHLLDKSFGQFIDNLSNKYLYGNLYMFDENLDSETALKRLSEVDQVCFQDNLKTGTNILKDKLQLNNLELPDSRQRKFDHVVFQILDHEEQKAKSILEIEYNFYNEAKKLYLCQ